MEDSENKVSIKEFKVEEKPEDKVDIFISSYKKFDKHLDNKAYKIINGGDYEDERYSGITYHDNTGKNIANLNKHYNEYSRIFWVWKNYPLKDYVGFCSYRRYFEFLDDVPNFDELFKEYKIVLPKPINRQKNHRTVLMDYMHCHGTDILKVGKLIKAAFPEYTQDIIDVLNGYDLYSNGLFVMKREDFESFCKFMFTILFVYDKIMKFETHEDIVKYIEEHKDLYLKSFSPNDTVEYQARMHGFLAERILTIWVHHNFKPEEIKNYKIMRQVEL